jgi:hypothetical protein
VLARKIAITQPPNPQPSNPGFQPNERECGARWGPRLGWGTLKIVAWATRLYPIWDPHGSWVWVPIWNFAFKGDLRPLLMPDEPFGAATAQSATQKGCNAQE